LIQVLTVFRYSNSNTTFRLGKTVKFRRIWILIHQNLSRMNTKNVHQTSNVSIKLFLPINFYNKSFFLPIKLDNLRHNQLWNSSIIPHNSTFINCWWLLLLVFHPLTPINVNFHHQPSTHRNPSPISRNHFHVLSV
jgi:hypothetical protein